MDYNGGISMKRIIGATVLACLAAPLAAQEEGFCMSPCGYQPGGAALVFECQDVNLGKTLTREGLPSQLFETAGDFAVTMSERNPEMGINVVIPGEARIYYPCGLPLQ